MPFYLLRYTTQCDQKSEAGKDSDWIDVVIYMQNPFSVWLKLAGMGNLQQDNSIAWLKPVEIISCFYREFLDNLL